MKLCGSSQDARVRSKILCEYLQSMTQLMHLQYRTVHILLKPINRVELEQSFPNKCRADLGKYFVIQKLSMVLKNKSICIVFVFQIFIGTAINFQDCWSIFRKTIPWKFSCLHFADVYLAFGGTFMSWHIWKQAT